MASRGTLNIKKCLALAIVRSRREAEATIKVQSRGLTQPGTPDLERFKAFHSIYDVIQAHSTESKLPLGS